MMYTVLGPKHKNAILKQTSYTTTVVYMSAGVNRDHKSLNKIDLS